MDGFTAFNIYLSLKLHFESPSYDAIKYGFKTRSRRTSYEKRKDKFFFERIAYKYKTPQRVIDYFTSNFLNGMKWIGDANEEALNAYEKRLQSITYVLRQDMAIIREEGLTFDQACGVDSTFSKSPILDLLIHSRITFESVTLVDILVNFTKGLQRHLKDPLGLYNPYLLKVQKYKLLLQAKDIPLDRVKNIVIGTFT